MPGVYPKKQRLIAGFLVPALNSLEALKRVIAELAQKAADDERDGRAYVYTPTGSADTYGQNGDRAYDADYEYRKHADAWERWAKATF